MSGDAKDAADFLKLVRSLNRWTLSQAEVRKLANQLRSYAYVPAARIAFAGNVVLEPLPEYLLAHMVCDGIPTTSYCVPFDQLIQELIEPDSGLRRFDPTFLHLHFELESLLQGLRDRRAFETVEHRRAALHEILDYMVSMVDVSLEYTSATILLSNWGPPPSFALGMADFSSEYGESEFFAEMNLSLARAVRSKHRVQIVDVASLTAYHGLRNVRDRRLFYISKIPWNEGFFSPLADQLARHVKVSLGRIRKCLVVDLDNTLWAGVLGEEGPLGVRIGIGDPVGESHMDLQRKIVSLKQRGILIAACSKNNLEDVKEIFRMRPDMPLRVSDFACLEIGWNSKHESLCRIASYLGIGTDSLVFLDDNPAEIELVEELMPEVECVLLPADSNLRATCLDALHSLDRTYVTAEDAARAGRCAEAASRKSFQCNFADLRDYLRGLNTSIEITLVGDQLLARAHQLFTKTNQFNVTGRRYTLAELEHVINDPSSRLLIVHAKDRFGDLGWIAAALLQTRESFRSHIENLVLSCRAIGRGIEIPVLDHLRRIAFDSMGCLVLTAEYLPSRKNAQVSTLYESQGFQMTRQESDGTKHYELNRQTPYIAVCDWISVEVDHAKVYKAGSCR